MGLKINIKNLISFSPVDSIQKNNKKEVIRDASPKIVWDKVMSKAIRSEILLEQVNNNHSDKPFWLKIGELRFNFWIMLVSK